MIRVSTLTTVSVEVSNASGTLTDPSAITFTIRAPDGTTTTIPNGDSRIVHQSTGRYAIDELPNQPGIWKVNAQATNPTVSETVSFYVSDVWE
jgi:hypothetical protein